MRLDASIQSHVAEAAAVAMGCTQSDQLYFAYMIDNCAHLHAGNLHQEDANLAETAKALGYGLRDEFKWLFALALKHGPSRSVRSPEPRAVKVPTLQGDLTKLATKAHRKFEFRSFLTLLDFRPTESGARMSATITDGLGDPDAKKLWSYYQRIERDRWRASQTQSDTELIPAFIREFQPHAAEFERAFGLGLSEFRLLIRWLADSTRSRMEAAEPTLPRLPNGNVAPMSMTALNAFASAWAFSKAEIAEALSTEAATCLERLSLNEVRFDESELRFHALTRRPIVRWSETHFLVVPPLLLNSIFVNTHYTLLEAPKEDAESYKARAADLFVDRVAATAAEFGYSELRREVDLRDGKKNLGDIDLWLRHVDGLDLLVECKAHALPLEVYFRDTPAVLSHLEGLRSKWEAKVQARLNHIQLNRAALGVGERFLYIVVSRFPEVISHYSEILTLSEQEFAAWLHLDPRPTTFEEVSEAIYSGTSHMPDQMLHAFQDIGLVQFEFG